MKFKINRNLLLKNLNNVSKGLSNKPQMPILTGIKLDVKDRYILLTASNFDISIQAKIDDVSYFDIEETGTCVLPGKYLLEILRKTTSDEVIFTSFEDKFSSLSNLSFSSKSYLSIILLGKSFLSI